jgi:hypothetical protein
LRQAAAAKKQENRPLKKTKKTAYIALSPALTNRRPTGAPSGYL